MKYILIAAVIILAIFLVVLSQIPIGVEPLTEVYLNNHTTLPINVYLNKTYNFSFTTHNLEYQDVNYKYTVYALDTNNTILFKVDEGNFTIKNNETKTISENYIFRKPFDRAKIQINLTKNLIGTPDFKTRFWWPDPNYPKNIDIHFWINEIVQTKITIIKA